jgi:peptide deformylase
MIQPIRLYGDPVLRRAARPVTRFDAGLRALVDDLVDTLIEADGLGLAAPQIGVGARVFVVAGAADAPPPAADAPAAAGAPADGASDETDEQEPSIEEQRASAMVFVNPRLEALEGRQVGIEGCLSLPALYHERIERSARLRLRYQDVAGMHHERLAEGRFAVVVQHEHDHLDGVLFIDRLSEADRFAFLDEHRAALAQMQRDAKAALRTAARAVARSSR